MKGPTNLGLSFRQGRHSLMSRVDSQTFCPGWYSGLDDRRTSAAILCLHTACCSWWWVASQTPSEPVVDRRDVWWFPGPWKQGRLETEYALEGSESSRALTEGILGVLGPAKELVPRVLAAMAEGSQEASHVLDFALGLPIRLRMIPGGEAYGHT